MSEPGSTFDELVARLPADALSIDAGDRRSAAHDWWTAALLGEAHEDVVMPDAVAFPTSTADVATILAWASETGTSVVPRGGGSGVSGGAQATEGAVVLDLSRMDRVIRVDDISGTVEVQAGILGDVLEAALETHGLTTGHYPQSIALSTVGGWIAAAGAGQASAGYGVIEDLLLGLTVVLAGGETVRLRAVPRSAAGPDLRRLFVGSEGTFGVITEAVLSCARLPEAYVWEAFCFGSFEATIDTAREIERGDVRPLIVRSYDEADAMLSFGRIGHTGGCVLVLGFGDPSPGLEDRRLAAVAAAAAGGGEPLPPAYGEHWWAHRNDAVDTYRRIMGPERMFGPGVVVDTMEVAALWRHLPGLHAAVHEALSRHAEAVGAHLSHPYRSGASLYFTFLVRGADDDAAVEAYGQAWRDAVQACLAAGGTMTHHHGVGLLKVPFMEDELGRTGLDLLRRVKRSLDPDGLLNPGKLIPDDAGPDEGS